MNMLQLAWVSSAKTKMDYMMGFRTHKLLCFMKIIIVMIICLLGITVSFLVC